MTLRPPTGTRDLLGPQLAQRREIERALSGAFAAAGYSEIQTPMIEDRALFERGVGGEMVRKEMFEIEDGDSALVLRPEGTAAVARAYLAQLTKAPRPVKLRYSGSFFRRERPQRGRFREFTQVGAEVIGGYAPLTAAELITVADEALRELSVRGIRLRLSTLGGRESRELYLPKLQAFLRARAGELSDEVRARIESNPLRVFDSTDERAQKVMREAPVLLGELPEGELAELSEFKKLLDLARVSYEVDPTLVRGLDYYSGLVWEWEAEGLGSQAAIGGGGCYDALLEELGGTAEPAAGLALGVDRIQLGVGEGAEELAAATPQVVVVTEESSPALRARAWELSRELGRLGVSARVDVCARSLKAQMRYADRSGARLAVIVEEKQTVARDMRAAAQWSYETTSSTAAAGWIADRVLLEERGLGSE